MLFLVQVPEFQALQFSKPGEAEEGVDWGVNGRKQCPEQKQDLSDAG